MEVKASDLQSASEVLERMHKQYAGLAVAAAVLRELGALRGAIEEATRLHAAKKAELSAATAELDIAREAVEAECAKAVQTSRDAAAVAEAERGRAISEAERCIADAKASAQTIVVEARAKAQETLKDLERDTAGARALCAQQRALAADAESQAKRTRAEITELERKLDSVKREARKILGEA